MKRYVIEFANDQLRGITTSRRRNTIRRAVKDYRDGFITPCEACELIATAGNFFRPKSKVYYIIMSEVNGYYNVEEDTIYTSYADAQAAKSRLEKQWNAKDAYYIREMNLA